MTHRSGLVSVWRVKKDDARFAELARLVFDHAQLGAEGKLDDAPGYLRRVNALLTELAD
jgi:Molecular chaperone, HSP90 family